MTYRSELTPKELTVLSLAAQGLSNEEICKKMFLSESTIKFHRKHIYQKLNTTHMVEAVVIGIKKGLVECPCGGRVKTVTINNIEYEKVDR